MAKADKATVAQRVAEILTMRLAGAGYPEILQYSAEKGWGLQERQLREYMARSDDLLAASLEHDRAKLLALHLAQRRLLVNRALETGDYGTALRVLQDSAKLQDLYPSAKRESLDVLLSFAPPELAAAIRAELAGLVPGGGGPPDAGGPPGPDGDPPRPGPDPDPGGDEAGPVAGAGDPVLGEESPDELWPANWKE